MQLTFLPPQRGKIRNRQSAQQLRDFSGLRFGTITPTDIDAYIEINDTLFVFIEAKRIGMDLPSGQKIALVRLCNAIQGMCNKQGKTRTAVLLVVEHNTPVDQDVDYAQTRVRRVFHNGNWHEPIQRYTLRQAIEHYIEQTGLQDYIQRLRS